MFMRLKAYTVDGKYLKIRHGVQKIKRNDFLPGHESVSIRGEPDAKKSPHLIFALLNFPSTDTKSLY